MMSAVIPRWEWRTFAVDLSNDVTFLTSYSCKNIRESSEIYILHDNSNINVKIRHNTLDIKALLKTDKHHFEQWFPLLKSSFPLSHGDLNSLFKTLDLSVPAPGERIYSIEDFLKMIDTCPALKTSDVKKKRFGYHINSCIVEYAHVRFNDHPYDTVAVEHTDPETLLKTLKETGLYGRKNINYVEALKMDLDITNKDGK
jgi:hypothetical protein